MRTKSLFALSLSIFLFFVVLLEALQCGTIYNCTDKDGIITLPDRLLEGDYKCISLDSNGDITDSGRRAREVEDKAIKRTEKAKKTEEKQQREIEQQIPQVYRPENNAHDLISGGFPYP